MAGIPKREVARRLVRHQKPLFSAELPCIIVPMFQPNWAWGTSINAVWHKRWRLHSGLGCILSYYGRLIVTILLWHFVNASCLLTFTLTYWIVCLQHPSQCWFNVGPAWPTLTNIGSTCLCRNAQQNASVLLGHRLWRWPNIKPALIQFALGHNIFSWAPNTISWTRNKTNEKIKSHGPNPATVLTNYRLKCWEISDCQNEVIVRIAPAQ